MKIQTKTYGENQVVISADDFKKLVEIAQKFETVKIEEADFDVYDLMRLSEGGGALNFLHDEREDIYTIDDLKVKYK